MLSPYKTKNYVETIGLDLIQVSQQKTESLLFDLFKAHLEYFEVSSDKDDSEESHCFRNILKNASCNDRLWNLLFFEVLKALDFNVRLLTLDRPPVLNPQELGSQKVIVEVIFGSKVIYLGYVTTPLVIEVQMS